jgi:hypothetical protein
MTDKKQDDAAASKTTKQRGNTVKSRSIFEREQVYKPIELSDVVSGHFDDEESAPALDLSLIHI